MKLINNLKKLKGKYKSPVLTIGMFDGVHLAHQRIIRAVIQEAKKIKGTSLVLTFSPHPLRVVKKFPPTPLITSLAHRIKLIAALGVDVCLLADFNKEFARISARDFIKDILVDIIGVKYIIVGEGFRFGKNAGGNFFLLERLSKIYNYKIKEIKIIKSAAAGISSTRIRALIHKGKIEMARKLLGRNFSIYGRVKKGNARGQVLGYPTANIEAEQEIIPAHGVYAVLIQLDNKFFRGLLNIGTRPTFAGKNKLSAVSEVHIFNFQKCIYGKRLEVFFIKRIRSEKKFASQEALLAQIKKDEQQARLILQKQKPPASI